MAVGEQPNIFVLFEAQATNANSVTAAVRSEGDKYVHVSGAFDGGTVTLEMANSQEVWAPMDGGVFTEAGVRLLAGIPRCASIRAVLSDSSGSSTITVEITK